MQVTRERILNILKVRGQATVNELSEALDLTTVTIRHHLDTLRREGLVAAPSVRHRKAPGRPQHVYSLTEEAVSFFPKRYDHLTNLLLDEISVRLSQEDIRQVMEQIGKRLAGQVQFPVEASFQERLSIVVDFLNDYGYMASWEPAKDGSYLVSIANCPYEEVSRQHEEVCIVDQTLMTHLFDSAVEHRETATESESEHCRYVVQDPDQ